MTTAPFTKTPSLTQVGRHFWTNPSPWILATFLVGTLIARVVVGDVQRTDVAVLVVLLAVQPLVEWVVHVTILHFRPRQWRGRTIDLLLSRKHREHHADPRDPDLVYIPWPVLLWLVPVELAAAAVLFERTGLAVSYLVTVGMIGMIYEWTHFLVHSDYRPKTALYRGIWRHHRLHHFKNERYWMAISRTWPDRLLRTSPDARSVATSPTVQNLHADSLTG
ncbi:MAG: hypothetical protein ACI867_001936 [Glaciecola sp.]|jgi:hypothetical protein